MTIRELPRIGEAAPIPGHRARNVQPLVSSLLATLVDIDFAYECERKKLAGGRSSAGARNIAARRLEERYRARRAPYLEEVRRLLERAET